MADFSEIIDQGQLKEHMQNALLTDKVSHAYIISGEAGSGKEFVGTKRNETDSRRLVTHARHV